MRYFYKKARDHPANRPYSLREAACDHLLLSVHCSGCRRTVIFLASDMVNLEHLDGNRSALSPPLMCFQCQRPEKMSVTLRAPAPGDHGALDIRRPAGRRITQLWKTVKLSDD